MEWPVVIYEVVVVLLWLKGLDGVVSQNTEVVVVPL